MERGLMDGYLSGWMSNVFMNKHHNPQTLLASCPPTPNPKGEPGGPG